MCTSFLAAVLLVGAADATAGKYPGRPSHPLAPSLPVLTAQEEQRIEEIIDRFIKFDTGKLGGAEGRKAAQEFQHLGPEAIFLLIEGFNRAANLQDSCPAVLIGKKIASLLGKSEDLDLLTFAKENLGAGVTARRHMGSVKDLQLGCILRRAAVQKKLAADPNYLFQKSMPARSVHALLLMAEKERGGRLQMVLGELAKRDHPKVLDMLALAAGSSERDLREVGRSLLVSHISRQPSTLLTRQLHHDQAAIRAAAAKVVGTKRLPLGSDLIELLSDADEAVQQAARQALVQLSRGLDHGPAPGASTSARALAIQQWQTWWAKRK